MYFPDPGGDSTRVYTLRIFSWGVLLSINSDSISGNTALPTFQFI